MSDNSYVIYGYKFKISDLNEKYNKLDSHVVGYSIKTKMDSYVPTPGGNPSFSTVFFETDLYLYIGYICKRFHSGQELDENFTHMCFCPMTIRKALNSAWADSKFTNMTSNIVPGFYFI